MLGMWRCYTWSKLNEESHKAVFHEGDCQGWIYRKSAGLTHPAFDNLSESMPYPWSHCRFTTQYKEICTLKDTIKRLYIKQISWIWRNANDKSSKGCTNNESKIYYSIKGYIWQRELTTPETSNWLSSTIYPTINWKGFENNT